MPIPRTGSGDSNRMPRWLPKAVVLCVVAVMLGVLTWHAISSLSTILLMLLCSLFVSLALEPVVDWLSARSIRGRHLRRGASTGIVMVAGILLVVVIVGLFGNMFVSQLSELVDQAVKAWPTVSQFLTQKLGWQPPTDLQSLDMSQINKLIQSYGLDVVSGAVSVGATVAQVVVSLAGMLLIVFYMVAQGPRLRQTICRPLPPARQKEVLAMWEISQEKISGYINSRIILAALSTFFTYLFLQFVVQVPYSLPLAVFVGVISQFVPTIGTYIAGAAPVLVALTIDPLKALWTLVFIILYQQVENLVFSPKISSRTMDINPAVAFVSVLAFGAVMGPIGAFLSVPLAATIQAILGTYVHRYELIDSTLLGGPETGAHAGAAHEEVPAPPSDDAQAVAPDSPEPVPSDTEDTPGQVP